MQDFVHQQYKSCVTLMILDYGNYGIFHIMGDAGFVSSTVGFSIQVLEPCHQAYSASKAFCAKAIIFSDIFTTHARQTRNPQSPPARKNPTPKTANRKIHNQKGWKPKASRGGACYRAWPRPEQLPSALLKTFARVQGLGLER